MEYMESKEIIDKTNKLFYGLMKEATRYSLTEFLEEWGLTYDDYEEISAFLETKGFKL